MAVPYQKLRSSLETSFDDDDGVVPWRSRSRVQYWSRMKRVPIRRRLKVRLPGRLRRLLRKKVASVSATWGRVMQRLKEGQEHFGDLFTGNYVFLQVNPTPVKKYMERSYALGVYGFPSNPNPNPTKVA